MANKLKTLKDLVFENVISYGQDSLFWTQKDGEDKKFVFPDRLKQEAIKWMLDDRHCSNDDPCERCEGTINFIKHFFNITEDEEFDALVSEGEQK